MRFHAAILGMGYLICAHGSAHAQAFVDEPNSLSMGLSYTYAPSGKLLAESGGLEVPSMTMFAHVLVPSVQYSTPLNGLQVEAEVSFVAMKAGSDRFDHFPANGEWDDGELHYTATDFKGGLRYQIKPIEEQLGLSFLLAGSIPTHDYPTFGLVAPGHGLKALYFGVAVARTFQPVIPNLFFQAQYQYALRERVDADETTEELNRDYSEPELTLGYFLPANFTIDANASARFSHGGATFETIIFESEAVQFHHDQLLDEDWVFVGADLVYGLSEKVDLGAAVRFFVWGQNTRNQNLYSLFANFKLF
jgi:hypothetical protein